MADLANFMPTAGSSSIEAVENITKVDEATIIPSQGYEAGNLNVVSQVDCFASAGVCAVTLSGASTFATLQKSNLTDISLIANSIFFSDSSYSSEITNGITIEGIEGTTFARGNLTGTRAADNSPLEFKTFAGWLDGRVFGTIQISIGESTAQQHQFISYNVGVPETSNPSATGSETDSATWEGTTVASIKDSREFIFGDATITVDFTNTNVDLEFDNWRDLDNQTVSSVSKISYEDLTIANGIFPRIGREVYGRFYGTGHTGVAGWFNTLDVTGAFDATRQ